MNKYEQLINSQKEEIKYLRDQNKMLQDKLMALYDPEAYRAHKIFSREKPELTEAQKALRQKRIEQIQKDHTGIMELINDNENPYRPKPEELNE